MARSKKLATINTVECAKSPSLGDEGASTTSHARAGHAGLYLVLNQDRISPASVVLIHKAPSIHALKQCSAATVENRCREVHCRHQLVIDLTHLMSCVEPDQWHADHALIVVRPLEHKTVITHEIPVIRQKNHHGIAALIIGLQGVENRADCIIHNRDQTEGQGKDTHRPKNAYAREIGITQTAITKSIGELENMLDLPLFDRSSQDVTLTKFGEQIHRRALQIDMQSGFLVREMNELKTGTAGTLRIGAGTVWSAMFLPQVLAELSKSCPDVEFVIRRSVGNRFKAQLEAAEIDVGLGLEPSPEDLTTDLVFTPMVNIKTLLLVRNQHPLMQKKIPGLADIAAYRWAMYRLDTKLFDQVRRLFLNDGLSLATPMFMADSSASVMGFVAKIDCVTVLPAPMLPIAQRYGLSALPLIEGPSFVSGAVSMTAADYPLMGRFMRTLESFARALAKT